MPLRTMTFEHGCSIDFETGYAQFVQTKKTKKQTKSQKNKKKISLLHSLLSSHNGPQNVFRNFSDRDLQLWRINRHAFY